MTEREWEILFMPITNGITHPHLPFTNDVSVRYSKTISPPLSYLSSRSILTHPVHLLSMELCVFINTNKLIEGTAEKVNRELF